MGRRRQAAERHSSAVESPFPSSPTRPPKYSLHFSDAEGRIYTPGFATCFGAKKAVDYVLEQSYSWEWKSKTLIRAYTNSEEDTKEDRWLEIKSEELEEIIEYEWLNQSEAEWILPTPFDRELDRIRGIKFDSRVSEESQRDTKRVGTTGKRRRGADDDESSTGAKGTDRHQPRVDGDEGVKRGRSRRDDALVSLADIAEELGIEPRKARAALRGKVDKPAGGWSWPKDEIDAIKKLLK